MNRLTRHLVLGTTLALSLTLATTAARAASISTLSTENISATQFNNLFAPLNTAILSPFEFAGSSSTSGMVESQVFQGSGAAAGLYAYAYQVAANPTTDGTGSPVHVDSLSFAFNGTSLGTNLTGAANPAYAYVITNGQVGGLNLSGTQTPTSLSWQPGQTTGFIRAEYVDPTTQTNPINAGNNSATFVLISNQLPSSVQPTVNVGGGSATTTVPVVYTTQPGTIEPVPVPEPASILAWGGLAGALVLLRRVRSAKAAV
jgi:hypothetical protein